MAIALLIAMVAFLICPKKDKAVVAGLLFEAVVLSLYLAWSFKIPERVLVPIILCAVTFTSLILMRQRLHRVQHKSRRAGTFVLLLCLLALPLDAQQTVKLNREATLTRQAWQSCMEFLRPAPEKLFVFRDTALGEWLPPWATHQDLENLNIWPHGWLTQSPLERRTAEHFNIDNIYLALAYRPNVFLVVNKRKHGEHELSNYILEHHGLQTRFVKIRTLNLPPQGVLAHPFSRSYALELGKLEVVDGCEDDSPPKAPATLPIVETRK